MNEKWMKQFLQKNPSLSEKMKRLEDLARVESMIVNDLGFLVAYQQNFSPIFSLNLVRLQRSGANGRETKKIQLKNNYFANNEETIRLIYLANKIRIALFEIISKIVSKDDVKTIQNVHSLFDSIIALRNIKSVTFKNSFASLQLFKIAKMKKHNQMKKNKKLKGVFKFASSYINTSYVPSNCSIAYIRSKIHHQNLDKCSFRKVLKSLNSDLYASYKELSNLNCEYRISNIMIEDYLKFPPFDVIRESPIFYEMNNSIFYSMNFVRSEITSLFNNLRDLVQRVDKFGALANNIYQLPQFEININHENSCNLYDASHRLALLNNIIQSSDVFKPHFPEYNSIKYIHADLENLQKMIDILKNSENLHDEMSAALESSLDYYSTMSDTISNEIEEVEHRNKEIAKRITQWQAKKINPLSEEVNQKRDKLIKSTENIKKDFYEKKNEISQLLQQTLNSFKDKISDVFIEKPLIPFNFEDLLNKYFYKQPEINWIDQRLEFQRKENENIKKRILKLKQYYSDIKDDISDKQNIIKSLKENGKQDKTEINLKKINRKYYCTVCEFQPKEVLISKCGHTFCKNCLHEKRNCPICNIDFDESNIVEIQW